MSGIGRGGRGAALLQALETPVRKPGQQTNQQPLQPQYPPTLQTEQAFGDALRQPDGGAQSNGRDAPAAAAAQRANGQRTNSGDIPMGRGGQIYQILAGRGMPRAPGSDAMSQVSSVVDTMPKLKIQDKVSTSSGIGSQSSSGSGLPSSQSVSDPSSSRGSSDRLSSQDSSPRVSPPGSVVGVSSEPKLGHQGNSLNLAVNYIPLRRKKGGVYQYVVSFSPEVESKGMRVAMINEHKDIIGNTKAFDGSQLYLPFRLPQITTEVNSKRATDGALIAISITLVKVAEPDQCNQLYNIIFRRVMRHLRMQQVGRNYFDATKPVRIPQHKLELWPGYVTSVRYYDGGLLLVTDVSHRTLRTDTVLDVMYEMYQKYPRNFQDQVSRKLIGCVVLTRYNNRTYRVDDIAWEMNPQSTFKCHDGSEIRFMDYYQKQYNLSISDMEQPLLINKPKRKQMSRGVKSKQPAAASSETEKICLIPELSCMTGLTDDTRSDFRAMKDIASHTRLTPVDRVRSLRKFVERILSSEEAMAELQSWGLTLDTDILNVTGRQLQSEKIMLKTKSMIASPDASWSKEIMNEHMITAVPLQSWIIVFTKKDQRNAMEFIKMLQKVGPPMGMAVKDPMVLELKDDRTETFIRSIRDNLSEQVQLVVVVQPTSRDDRYAAIKKLCCVQSPVPSQVINGRTIAQVQKLRSITQKIALQINCKLGGELWALEIPLKNMMVIGIDVYHNKTTKGQSVGGFIASINPSHTRWYSRVCFQMPGQELMDGLRVCFLASLRKYYEVNGCLPDRVVVFRDGVGDGQMKVVEEYEAAQLQKCFATLSPDYKPKLSVIIVQKRINTRLLALQNGGSKFENPAPGAILDHTVTTVGWYDFFLVSQHVGQGTVSPTHYVVVYDDSNLKPDYMQRLTYKMTHLYYNWPGTIRVPAPCQYAHKLAFLVGQSIHRDPSLDLADKLFFL